MKSRRFIKSAIAVLSLAVLAGCQDAGSAPDANAYLEGQVLLVSTPGPIPVGWVPPPYETACTILILNETKTIVKESATDSKGKFSIAVSPGTYYVRVKESRVPAETGPFVLVTGQTAKVEAHFDNGMR